MPVDIYFVEYNTGSAFGDDCPFNRKLKAICKNFSYDACKRLCNESKRIGRCHC